MNDLYHGDETYQESHPLEREIGRLQEEIDDLKYRMNVLCTFLSMRYPDDIKTLELAGYR